MAFFTMISQDFTIGFEGFTHPRPETSEGVRGVTRPVQCVLGKGSDQSHEALWLKHSEINTTEYVYNRVAKQSSDTT